MSRIFGKIKILTDSEMERIHNTALDIIKRVGPGDTFIADPHTAEHFRKEFWLSDLAECLSWESYRIVAHAEKTLL